MPRIYARGTEFPNEGFIQEAIEKHFRTKGYELEVDKFADLVCIHPVAKEKWIIEAKGESQSIGIDFRTGLGQILPKMTDKNASYAIAVPHSPPFLRQCSGVPSWVRQTLRLYWLLVTEDGNVKEIAPGDGADIGDSTQIG